ncbi:class I SAM-dependent methyltransferase [Candidatus Sumerlaeota bacterium]|nr:class I SAM-dependent methyltransferase [Candidatus Sumerlaeota bacterium]
MSNKTIALDDKLREYLLSISVDEPEALRRLREETASLPMHGMQIAPEQGQFMRLILELTGARKALEIGTFTGYSAMWIAMGIGEEGRLIACDVSEEWTEIAARYWKVAGLEERIDLRLGPALKTMAELLKKGARATFDFIFIDADKQEYDAYYEEGLNLLRSGGLIAIDNALWDGRVADPKARDADTRAIRALNEKMRDDKRVSCSLVPIGDGLMLARKKYPHERVG